MKFLEFGYRDYDPELWEFPKIDLRKLNLFVGQTSAGKTRLLNSLFSLGYVAIREKVDRFGKWRVSFQVQNDIYRYRLETADLNTGPAVTKEILVRLDGSESFQIVKRDENGFYFDGALMPKLPLDQTSIHLLADEALISPVADGFGRIQKRQFDHDELEKAGHFAVADRTLENLLVERNSLFDLWKANAPLSLKLYYLQRCFPTQYTRIVNQFMEVFPSVSKCEVQKLRRRDIPFETKGIVPIFTVSEKGVKNEIGIQELSSGMKKVLLILADVVSAPLGTVYLIDEYENSLGVNAIDFLPILFATMNHRFNSLSQLITLI